MPRIKNAFFHRIHVRAWLAAALVGCLPVGAQAGYAQLASPAGFGGSPGNWTFAPSANDLRYGGTAYSPNALRVPGTSATMPSAYRFAANAPRIAAAAIFMNPYVRVGVGIASWLGVAGIVWDSVNNRWAKPDTNYPQSDGFVYQYRNVNYNSPSEACNAYIAYVGPRNPGVTYSVSSIINGPSSIRCVVNASTSSGNWSDNVDIGKSVSSCPAGWYVTPAGCVQNPPPKEITKPEFEDALAPSPMPQTVPWELPKPTPLPVEQPVINPDSVPNPVHRPLFVPTGDPVPNPQYDPNAAPGPNNHPWIQPGVRVNPSPTPSEPWRVDLQPVNRPVSGPEPMPEPDSENPPNPDKPSEEQLDFCVKNPDVLACAKTDLDTPEGEIPKSNKDVSLVEENLFGGGACPADVYFTPHGLQQLKVWDWNQSCGYITGYVKPILIICCTFAAFMILIPGRIE